MFEKLYRPPGSGPIIAATALVLASCSPGDNGHASAAAASTVRENAGVVDSIRPIGEEIRRFEATVDHEPTELTGGAASREALVAGFISALERGDTVALARPLLGRAEFIHLYFPHTVYTAPPYEMNPSFIWFQMMNVSSRGISRAYHRYAGRSLAYRGHTCAPAPHAEGPNLLWDRCTVSIAPDGAEMDLRLFGLILERDGQFKFVTYGNDL
jgi:hypothetical protein